MTRPSRVVVITGSSTEVGKTFVAAGLLAELRRRGLAVSARKPVQSYSLGELTDAEILARATGEVPERVCPADRCYAIPLAPPMAADALGRPPPTISALADELNRGWPDQPVDVGVVEGAGGVASPLAIDGDTAELARLVRADLAILVGEPQLGIINSARLTRLALRPVPLAVYLNRFDTSADLHRRNREWLIDHDRFDVSTTLEGLADLVVSTVGPVD